MFLVLPRLAVAVCDVEMLKVSEQSSLQSPGVQGMNSLCLWVSVSHISSAWL